jgi:predicted negative regulator of RcsB-dependent stress response
MDESVSLQKEEAEFSGWLKTAIILFIVIGVIIVLAMFIWMIFPLF